jgi:hypothetical protein
VKLTSLLAASCLLAAFASVARAQDIFTFDSQMAGTFLQNGQTLTADNDPLQMATVSITNGVDVQFSQNFAFQFESNGPGNTNYGTNLHDIVLTNADGLPNTVLTLTFAKPIDDLTVQFAMINGTLNNVPVNTLTLSGGDAPDTSGGVYNATSEDFEGSLATSTASGTFSTATFTFQGSAVNDFGYAIDSITTSPPAVPEPGVAALVLAGIIPAAGLLRRRRTR